MTIEELESENAKLRATVAALKQENAELKANQCKLENNVVLMQTIFDRLGDGVIAIDLKGEVLAVNRRLMDMMEVDPAKAETDESVNLYDHWSPYKIKMFQIDKVTPTPLEETPLFRALKGETTNYLEFFLTSEDMTDGIFLKVSGRPLFDETGNLIGGVAILHDITDLQAVRTELEAVISDLESQTQLMDVVFNSISDGIIVADKNGKYVLSNQAVKQMAGDNLIGAGIENVAERYGLFHEDGETLYRREELPITRALKGEQVDGLRMFLRELGGVEGGFYTSINARPIYDEKGVLTGAVSIIRDISPIKETERQLKETNNRLADQNELMQCIFNSISDGVIVVDENGGFTILNPSARQISGMTETLSPHDSFYFDKTTPFPYEELPIIQALRGKSTDNVEMFVQNEKVPSGVYLSVSGRPLMDSQGNQRGGVVVFHDVTHRIHSEEALHQAFMQGRLEVLDTILHNIGNAINSVAVGIDTVHQMTLTDKSAPRFTALAKAVEAHQENLGDYIQNHPQGQQVAAFMIALSQDLNNLMEALKTTVDRIRNKALHIVDIVRTQKSYHGVTTSTCKDVNLVAAISDAVKILQESIEKRGIRIEIDCENGPEEIRIQESQFQQMLVNLIKNSVEAIDELARSEAACDTPYIRFRTLLDDDFFYIDITDSGIGIDPKDAERIFSAGFTTKSQGSGLGLHSSANFVIGSGGHIHPLMDGSSKGTTMRVMLRRSSIQPKHHTSPTNRTSEDTCNTIHAS